MTLKEFLTSGGELSKEVEYTSDDDNVLVLYQGKSKINLSPDSRCKGVYECLY